MTVSRSLLLRLPANVNVLCQMWEDPEGIRVRSQRGLWLAVLGCRAAAGQTSQMDLLHSVGRQPGSSRGAFCRHRTGEGVFEWCGGAQFLRVLPHMLPLQRGCVCFHLHSCVFQEKAAEVLRAYRSSHLGSSPVLPFAELYSVCSGVCADESTLCMALLQLQRDKQVMVSLHDGEKVTSTLVQLRASGRLWRGPDDLCSQTGCQVLPARAGPSVPRQRRGRGHLPAAAQREAAGRASGEAGAGRPQVGRVITGGADVSPPPDGWC